MHAVADEAVDDVITELSQAVAFAFSGGARYLTSRAMGDAAVLQILHNAVAGVCVGELRR